MRSSGILLHISSLPSSYGIGTLGKAAYYFADFLSSAGQKYWQILPIGPTSYGDSPYQTFSTHAGNPYFIDLDTLISEGYLTRSEVEAVDWSAHTERVDYDFQFSARFPLLRRAYERGRDRDVEALAQFRRENPWVEDYALYMAVKCSRNMESWEHWPEEIRLRRPGAVETYATRYADDVSFFCFLQLLFYRQWNALRGYLHEKGILLIGDIPIYVPYDSCDVWANPELFQLDENGRPTAVAGCPPDCFSADGQLWGNPLYDWGRMAQDDFAWWKQRIDTASHLYDVTRLDHFRGLESYWAIPYGDTTARGGRWLPGPDHAFVEMLHRCFPRLALIAEDLGFLTDAVRRLQSDSGFPGMKVLEFAFDPREPSNYLPHRYERNCICYTGTHDNETLVQWLSTIAPETRAYVAEYLGVEPGSDLVYALIRAGMASVADTFIVQMQDVLELGADARMNLPGTVSTDNWSWRLAEDALTSELAARLRRMVELYER